MNLQCYHHLTVEPRQPINADDWQKYS